ncbi:MAG: S9 family peptidase [Sphingobacteriales bacterium UTBCD1]|jgi:dipeptidyl aminopeptidase/acylaminoacyl peptidase|nr:MAG: S9 family peptidase [Sphingobacteriales bacterium UTBCD1]
MKSKTGYLISFAFIIFASCGQDQNDSRTPQQYSPEQLRDNVSVSAADFNSDETALLISSNKTGIFNVYELNIADTGQKPLTASVKESFYAMSFLPGTDNFIFMHDEGGNENYHLYFKHKNDTTAKDLTPWTGSSNNFMNWSADKKSLFISSNHRDPRFFDIWKMDTGRWTPSLFYRNDSNLTASLISPSERYIALSKIITTDKNELFLYDRQNKNMKRLSNDNEANWIAAAFEKNDSTFYYTTNNGSEFTYLVKYNINNGRSEKFYEDKWDVDGMNLSENEKYHTITLNEDGKNKILLFDHAGNQPLNFPEIKDGNIEYVLISPSEKNMLLTVGSSTSPANLFVYNFENKNLKQLTSTLNKEVNEKDLVQAEVIRFTSFDGKQIPAIYYKPLQANKNNKAGALVWVHGGPGGQSRVGFNNSIQFLVNHGYAVLAVNNRGSSGYGKTFYKLDNKDHGYGDLKDCIWAKKWLVSKEYIDSNAVGIYGGSYGGNMVLNALCLHPDEFKAGVDLFGVANWIRTLKSIPPYWENARKALYEELGDPDTGDSVLLKATSPLFNYEKINKPLIVFQGANDVRVLKVESDEIVEGVKKNGVPVEYVVFPDEGHGFVKKENLITTDKRTLEFLNKYLKPGRSKN